MILADENISYKIIEALRTEGFEVYSIFEEWRGIKDVHIASYSLKPPRIILTEDKDFGQLVFEIGMPVTGIIFLRFNRKDKFIIAEMLIDFLKKESLESLTNKFVTITTEKIRVKEINN